MKTKKTLLFIGMLLCAMLLNAQALRLYDDFTGLNIANLAGQSSWTKGGTGPDATVANTTALTYAGYNGGGGEYVQMPAASGTASRVYKGFTSTAREGNTFFYSALIRISSVNATGDYFFTLGDPTTGTSYFARLFAKSSGSGYVLGASKLANVATADFGSTVLNFDQTYLVVVRYTGITGSANDLCYVWVNPSLASEPATGSAYVAVNVTLGDATNANVGNFHWHNRSLNNPTGAFDGVRVSFGATSADAWTALDAAATSAPAVEANPGSLSGFSYVINNGPSTPQSFVASGSNLTGNITITAPSNYQVSESSGSGYANSVVLYPSGGVVANTNIYVRLVSGLGIGSYNGSVTVSSSGATDKYVVCSGSVTPPAAPNAPVATAASGVDSDSFYANWNSVSGADGYYLDVYTQTAGSYASELFFSEYIEGSSNNKALEIYNGTGMTVDLIDYKVDLYSNGSSTVGNTVTLSGTLAHGDVFVIANSSANASILALADITSTVTFFNGDDALALKKISTDSYVDIFGMIGQDPGTAWTAAGEYSTLDKTLVRKSTVTQGVTVNPSGYAANDPAAFPTLGTEWDVYPIDTISYLGDHTVSWGVSVNYVAGYEDLDVENVLTYQVTGLDPAKTYYYVVRAYDAYSQVSANSNEIEVTTAALSIVIEADGSVTGATIAEGGDIPDALIGPDTGVPAVIYTITSTGTRNVTVYRPTGFGNIDWYCWLNTPTGLLAADNPIDGTSGSYLFNNVNFDAKGDVVVIINDNSTLPIELSVFAATINAYNYVQLTWVTQSETGVQGYYIFRSPINELSTAMMVSNMIPATNTSQQQTYVFVDSELTDDGMYYYWLQNADFNGSVTFHGPVSVQYSAGGNNNGTPAVPLSTQLRTAYPNPFNPSTRIPFDIAAKADVTIHIYNTRGQLVRSFPLGSKEVGSYHVEWNGKSDSGNACASGVYFVRMQAGSKSFSSKVLMMK